MPQVSIIIPVFNKWELTSACLASIAEHTPLDIEVIVLDNASTDDTPEKCPPLGASLFGHAFKYMRNERNLNFAGAGNQGAKLATGDFLLFLNNDTEVTDDWLGPLLDDFFEFPDLGATGPLLVYPKNPVFGHQVQHLGVRFTPFKQVNHLYQGIPAASSLARKRRFFQAITAACLLIPRQFFLEFGLFDEKFINGCEDLDLCARLLQKGLRMTVNPRATVIHYESQTLGRGAHDTQNAAHLKQKCVNVFQPDWHRLLAKDGYNLCLTDWLSLYGAEPGKQAGLSDEPAKYDFNELKDAIVERPLWHEGWLALVEKCKDWEEKHNQAEVAYRLKQIPQIPLLMLGEALKKRDEDKLIYWHREALVYDEDPLYYLKHARAYQKFFHDRPGIARLYGSWIENYPQFRDVTWPFFRKRLEPFTRRGREPD